MRDLATLRDELRPHGVVSAACRTCFLLGACGGIQPRRSLMNCFDLNCCGGKADCKRICLNNNPDFMRRLEEVGGLRFDDLKPLSQRSAELPQYVPVIDHRKDRYGTLDYPAIALSTYRVVRLKGKRYRTLTDDPKALRAAFGVAEDARDILRGTARDPLLERYWQYGDRDDAAGQLAALGVSLIIAPNFSHVLNVPRSEHLYNRRRQILCIESMVESGLNVAPHLSAVTPGDWDFWRGYLSENETVLRVAKEFQTGNKNRTQGRLSIESLADLQQALGRKLHPIVIGGAQFVEYVAARFETFTLIDSVPFAKTTRRRLFDPAAGKSPWRETWSLIGQGIDHILDHNVRRYAPWIEQRALFERSRPNLFMDVQPASKRIVTISAQAV